MVDAADRALADELVYQEHALNERLQRFEATAVAVSADNCWDCGSPIPEPRREAARGCTRCVECQALEEQTVEVRKCA
ncbi:TraR/DksA C4-type zinc finger protein [Pseudomonas sp. NPDC086581]|uniref:TraR/DksA C4-type zinc finger protein n=1 Tax=Pseudomonas sp. NPDC086581 TaxID=3364432 RepID=UPI003803FC98